MTAEQIRKVIARSGKSQREVARTLGISPQTLQTRLTAKSISADTIERIAAALGISPAEFYETELREENERLRKLVQEQMATIQALLNK
ncbi:MAG: helix-turn-helix transcriptional regulator [Alistipes sp.]|nr:helix-turn-helix transcriptional regulator [Alistipes sp.]